MNELVEEASKLFKICGDTLVIDGEVIATCVDPIEGPIFGKYYHHGPDKAGTPTSWDLELPHNRHLDWVEVDTIGRRNRLFLRNVKKKVTLKGLILTIRKLFSNE